jgi:hypothetical protein
MKVQELIERLKFANPEAEVHFAYNYGDHWNTVVAPPVRDVEDGMVIYSEYHRMDKLITDADDDNDEILDPVNPVIVLS